MEILESDVVQIEIDGSLYMDEARVAPNADFDAMCAVIGRVAGEIAEIGRGGEDMPLAAE